MTFTCLPLGFIHGGYVKNLSFLTLVLSLSIVASVGHAQKGAKKKKQTTSTTTTETSNPIDNSLANPGVPPVTDPAPATPTPVAETPPPMPTDAAPHYFGAHVALGIPSPLSGGLNYVHSSQIFSVELNMGSYGMKASDVDVKMSNAEIGLRWHPFMGSFFVGSYIGNRALVIEKSDTIQGQSINLKAEVKSNYVAPHVGWMWGMSNGGYFGGMELGVLSPSGAKASFSSNADAAVKTTKEYKDLNDEVKDQGEKLGEITLPLWTMIKIGWLF